MVGERLVAYRRINGMSQQQLADAMDISRQTVVRWEKKGNRIMFKRITVLLLFLIILTTFGICSCNSKLQQEPAVSNEASQESEGTSAQTELEDITVVTEETD